MVWHDDHYCSGHSEWQEEAQIGQNVKMVSATLTRPIALKLQTWPNHITEITVLGVCVCVCVSECVSLAREIDSVSLCHVSLYMGIYMLCDALNYVPKTHSYDTCLNFVKPLLYVTVLRDFQIEQVCHITPKWNIVQGVIVVTECYFISSPCSSARLANISCLRRRTLRETKTRRYESRASEMRGAGATKTLSSGNLGDIS